MTCEKCGFDIICGESFCPNCGTATAGKLKKIYEEIHAPNPFGSSLGNSLPPSFMGCSNCGKTIYAIPGKSLCDDCIAALEATRSKQVCPSCGKTVPARNKFCTGCGTKLQKPGFAAKLKRILSKHL